VFAFPFALVFDKAILDPQTLRYELQIDSTPTFGSLNLIDVFSNSKNIINYQNGPLGKAIEVQLPGRQSNAATTWYWRMRINGYGYAGNYTSPWSQTNTLIVPANQTLGQATALFAGIADQYAYSKTANSSNIYKIMDMIARELDLLLLESTYSQRDLTLAQARDAGLSANFGTLTGLTAVATEPAVSYRWKVNQLFNAFLTVPGVLAGITQVVEAFVGEPPLILDATNTVGWILGINKIKAPAYPAVQPTIKLYSRFDKGFNWTLQIFNSWGLSYDSTVLEDYVNQIKPAHTNTVFKYSTTKHAQLRMNTAADWSSWTLTNMVVNQSGALTLAPGQASGTATSPVFQLPFTPTAWGVVGMSRVIQSSNQTIVYQIQSSTTGSGGSFSGYETVSNGGTPASTPLRSFVQQQITMSTTNANIQPILTELDQDINHS
jgi:hypothetical protein